MRYALLVFAALFTLTAASPVKQEKRSPFGSLAGILRVDQTFDYIVLGGGTAGLTIAKRLAKDPSISVAVIEAGSLYQVTDAIIEDTPAGALLFIGTLLVFLVILE